MKTISSEDFIEAISSEKGAYILFSNSSDKIGKIEKTFQEFTVEYPLLEQYHFMVDKTLDNILLSEEVEIPQTPCLILFRNGNFVKYKNKDLNKKNIIKFVGKIERFKQG